jgi:hypothetical protein
LGGSGSIIYAIEQTNLVVVRAEHIDKRKKRLNLRRPLKRVTCEQVNADTGPHPTSKCCGFGDHVMILESLGTTDV